MPATTGEGRGSEGGKGRKPKQGVLMSDYGQRQSGFNFTGLSWGTDQATPQEDSTRGAKRLGYFSSYSRPPLAEGRSGRISTLARGPGEGVSSLEW